MNIKAFAHQAQGRLEASTGLQLKRSHVYELVAAALGEKSYAALQSRGVLCPLPSLPLRNRYARCNREAIERRAIFLGYQSDIAPLLSRELSQQLAEAHLGVVPYGGVVRTLLEGVRELYEEPLQDEAYDKEFDAAMEDDGAWDAFDEKYRSGLDLRSAWVIDGLHQAAARGEGLAHFALGLLGYGAPDHVGGDDWDDEWDEVPDALAGRYWYERGQSEVLTGVEREWADEYASRIASLDDSRVFMDRGSGTAKQHLLWAAEAGFHDALLILADRFGDDRFFDLEQPYVTLDPLWIADLAERVGRYEWSQAWKTVAAEQGNVVAMRDLIENEHRSDSFKCWTWYHLAKLHGVDITQSNYRAIHGDGSGYDDDVGGPMFAVGEDGVQLPAATADIQAQALALAEVLFQAYPNH